MIQTYKQLQSSIYEFNKLVEKKPAQIQKIYSSAYAVDIVARFPGKTIHLILGRGKIYEGISIESKVIPSEYRKQDKFLSYLRKSLTNTALLSLEMDQRDRSFKLRYGKWGKENSLNFFYNGKALYFSNDYYSEKDQRFFSFKSWTLKVEDKPAGFDGFDDVGRKDIENKEKMKSDFCLSDVLNLEKERSLKSPMKTKALKKVSRKISHIEKDLAKVNQYKVLQDWVEKEEDFTQFPKKYKYQGVKFNFTFKEHYKRRNQVFEKIKAFKRAVNLLERRLDEARQDKEKLDESRVSYKLDPVAPYWGHKKNIKSVVSSDKDYKVFNFEGFSVGLGTSARGNDQLRSMFAGKNDLWFHLDSMESPHAIVKGNIDLTEERLNLLASLLLDYGKYDLLNVGIIYTKVKDIKGVKGSPGKVLFKKEKRYYATKIDWRTSLLTV